MKKVLTSAILTLGLAASFAVSAQQTTDAPQAQGAPQAEGQGRRMRGMRGGKHRGMRKHGRGMRAFGQLNLTDAQKERMRSIHEGARQGTQARREELRQIFMTKRQGGQLTPEQEARARQLRDELREARQRTHNDALGVLTTEQSAQLDKMKQEHKARREEMRKRRGEMRSRREQMREGTGQPPQQ
ncbi:MAG: Spy/CpxP family protein refolding chaperone [Rubrivivax sp.]|nr:Spy/CpxP family protein refolding chaperone [Pyrinomonadaceae bacterium]